MKSHIAEYVSPGHPDRLADAIAESIVDLAVGRDPMAMVAVECAVHADHVFIDGRIVAGPHEERCVVARKEIEAVAREVYRKAGYGVIWRPMPEKLMVIQNVRREPMSDEECAIRDISDDQNVVTGYACNSPATDYLPPAHFVANFIGRNLYLRRKLKTWSEKFGPDIKVMVNLDEKDGRYEWRRLTISFQHNEGVFAEEQHKLIMSWVNGRLALLEDRGLKGIANLPPERFVLNGMGDFIIGGPEGDNGLSGKKLVVDFYGPGVPIGGGAICGKDPHKVDVAGAFRARELALRLLKEGGGAAVLVRLGWSPGDTTPAFREAERIDSFGLTRPIPASALPPDDWFSIKSIVKDLNLTKICRREKVLFGYF